jgi:hypothetical protein
VDLFFLDPNEAAASLVSFRGRDGQNPKPTNPTLYEIMKQRREQAGLPSDVDSVRDARNAKYKLLFSGEVMGVQWVKAVYSRSLVIQCLDHTNYWDYAYQFNNTDIFGPSQKALFSGGSTNLLTDFLSSPGEIVTSLLRQPSANYPNLKGLLGGLIRMMEGIGGCYFQDNKFQGQNIFYSLAELRLHITQMITAYEDDLTVSRLLGGGSYDGLFGRTLGNLGDQVSIRTVLNALMGIIFHETYAVPTPAFFPGTNSDTLGRNRQKLSSLPQYQNLYQLLLTVRRQIEEMTNGLNREPITTASQQFDPVADARTYQRTLTQMTQLLDRQRYLRASDPVFKRNRFVMERVQQISALLRSANVAIRQAGPAIFGQSKKNSVVVVALNKARILTQGLESVEVDISDPKTRLPSRLAAHIFRPDIWFGAPPRCNVLFPEHGEQIQYERSFMQEPTRLLLKTHDELFGEEVLFNKHFFAPSARTQKGKKSTLTALFERDIMQHELLTGILPIFTKMGELNIFALRTGKVNGKMPKISLAQRSANYLYFKQRFASRRMVHSGPFNPYIAPGFPGLILDTYVALDDAEKYREGEVSKGKTPTDIAKLLGAHYLGNFSAVNHSLSPTSAKTTVQIQYPRLYDESSEFFGPAIQDDQTILQRLDGDGLRYTQVAAITKPQLGALGPAYGVIDKVTDITEEATRLGHSYPVYTGPRRRGDPALEGEAKVGVPVRVGDVSPHLSQTLGPNKIVVFRSYMIYEKIPRYRRETVDLPAEEFIRPGWFADCWHPSEIGYVYHRFLRTGAITDKTQIGDPDGIPVGGKGQLARDQLVVNATSNREGAMREGISPAVLTLDIDASVEQATRFLLLTYSYIRQSGLSPSKFISAYTYRPIATLVDMYGTSDLELDGLGVKAVKGIEGFHSRAAGPYEDLFGLVTPEITEVLGAKKTDLARQLGDVRGRRHQAVLDYQASLSSALQMGNQVGQGRTTP